MLEELESVVRACVAEKPGLRLSQFALSGTDCWSVRCCVTLDGAEELCFRNVAPGDEPVLSDFGENLGSVSKDLFCPYPWHDEARLPGAFETAVRQSVERVDLSFLMFHNGRPIGHFFLWKAGGNPHSATYGLQVPELGLAVADTHQGRGLGAFSVRVLLLMARSLDADAVELTTSFENRAGWRTYIKTGFEHVGDIRIPLGVDVTSAPDPGIQPTRLREEHQLVCILKPEQRSRVMQYLAVKRAEFAQSPD